LISESRQDTPNARQIALIGTSNFGLTCKSLAQCRRETQNNGGVHMRTCC
jgi:hypothetical protein